MTIQVTQEKSVPASQTPTLDSFITIENLNAFYGSGQVLKNINLDFRDHEIQAIMGPSGCGKTTLIRIINRMNDHIPGFRIDGTVRIEGTNIYGKGIDPVLLKLRIGMVFQTPNPFPFSIFDNVAFGPRIHKLYKKRKDLNMIVKDSLQRAFLWDEVKGRLKESALKLSGGQQQRLCIARALAVQPQVLLMDEPASALDPGSTSKIEELIVDLKQNYTVIMVTHNMQQAARIADNAIFLYKGEVVERGSAPEIFQNPTNPLTEKYLSGQLTNI